MKLSVSSDNRGSIPTLSLTVDPDFLALALEELRAHAPSAQILAEVEPGLLLISEIDFFELAARWLQEPPVFIRHIAPVMAIYAFQPLNGEQDESGLEGSSSFPPEILTEIAGEFAQYLDPSQSFSIQTRIQSGLEYKPFDINKPLAASLHAATGSSLDVRNPDQILSLLVADFQSEITPRPTVFAGLSLAIQNLSDWAGGKRRFAREKGQVSRAEFKLLEALEVFAIVLPPRGVALDLGAAPGGWTRVLRQREQYVTAIDPGALDLRIAADSRVRHLPVTAEAYLAGEPDQFDLIVNDMRMDARDSARLMVDYAGLLYRGGIGIMTLKLPEQNRPSILHHAFTILRQGYRIVNARHLFHNRSEITVYLKKL